MLQVFLNFFTELYFILDLKLYNYLVLSLICSCFDFLLSSSLKQLRNTAIYNLESIIQAMKVTKTKKTTAVQPTAAQYLYMMLDQFQLRKRYRMLKSEAAKVQKLLTKGYPLSISTFPLRSNLILQAKSNSPICLNMMAKHMMSNRNHLIFIMVCMKTLIMYFQQMKILSLMQRMRMTLKTFTLRRIIVREVELQMIEDPNAAHMMRSIIWQEIERRSTTFRGSLKYLVLRTNMSIRMSVSETQLSMKSKRLCRSSIPSLIPLWVKAIMIVCTKAIKKFIICTIFTPVDISSSSSTSSCLTFFLFYSLPSSCSMQAFDILIMMRLEKMQKKKIDMLMKKNEETYGLMKDENLPLIRVKLVLQTKWQTVNKALIMLLKFMRFH